MTGAPGPGGAGPRRVAGAGSREVTFSLAGPAVPALRMAVADGRRLAVLAGDRPVLFGRVEEGWWRVDLRLADPPEPVVPPIRAARARAWAGDPGAWAVWSAHELRRSPCSPLHAGEWAIGADRWILPGGRPRPVVAWDDVGRAVHDFGGPDRPVVPLRRLSPPDAPRVKAARRLIREHALPPVLLWEVTGLLGAVILDGHDRLAAALAEGVRPDLLLVARRDERSSVPANAAAERYETTMGHLATAGERGLAAEVRRRAEAEAARAVAAQSKPWPAPTWAWPYPGGADGWDRDGGIETIR